MDFQNLLIEYMNKYSCSVKELSELSGLSPTVISRYRSGERVPHLDSTQLDSLATGLSMLANSKNFNDSKESIFLSLKDSINKKNTDNEIFTSKFVTLMDALQISVKAVSKATNFDNSYIYRIRSGQRHPNNIDDFTNSFCQYVVANHNSETELAQVSSLLSCDVSEISNSSSYFNTLKNWFYQSSFASNSKEDEIQNFLRKLDEFDLNEYIKSIHFDTLKVPTVPVHLPSSKNYIGIEEMKKAELNFFKETALSKSKHSVFMCSDMPMEDMGKDLEFGKKWMFGIAATLKKGLHLDIIHNIDRPFNEMMLGLEAWIPIYMTGQISPYHLPNIKTNIYHHINYVSGVAALSGECIHGHHSTGKYYLTNNKEEVQYYQTKAKELLAKAEPLMKIYRDDTAIDYHNYEESTVQIEGNRRNFYSSLPIYTMSEELLRKILIRNNCSNEEIQKVLDYRTFKLNNILKVLNKNIITDQFPLIDSVNFSDKSMYLELSGAFIDKELFYTFEEYLQHYDETLQFEKSHNNYEINPYTTRTFNNIQIQIIEGNVVILSKEKAPAVHFVINHPKMVNALSNFVPYY